MDLTEPVWQEDVAKEVEYMREGLRTLKDFYLRIQAQGAPPELLSELWNSYQYLHEARRKLEAIQGCFHPEPQNDQ